MTAEFSFRYGIPLTCETPPLLAGTSSRRGSMDSFESSYSTATDCSSPISPSPVSQGRQQFTRRPTSPSNSAHPLFDDFHNQAQYLVGLSDSSVGEIYGCGELDPEFATGWDCHSFDDGSSGQTMPMASNGGLFLTCERFEGQMVGDIRQDLTGLHIYNNAPPTVLPSQLLNSPNPPASALATPFVSPMRTTPFYPNSSPVTLNFDLQAETGQAGPDLLPISSSRKRRRQEDYHDDEDPTGRFLPPLVIKSVTKPYPCLTCDKGFDRQEHLTRHNNAQIHRDILKQKNLNVPEQPIETFKCRFCDKRFDRSDNVKPHVRTHLHDGDQNFKNASVSVEESVAAGYGDIDPRVNKSAGCKKGPSKKARTKKRA